MAMTAAGNERGRGLSRKMLQGLGEGVASKHEDGLQYREITVSSWCPIHVHIYDDRRRLPDGMG